MYVPIYKIHPNIDGSKKLNPLCTIYTLESFQNNGNLPNFWYFENANNQGITIWDD